MLANGMSVTASSFHTKGAICRDVFVAYCKAKTELTVWALHWQVTTSKFMRYPCATTARNRN